MENPDQKLLEIIRNEKFLAFFDLAERGENGAVEIGGLCKVAMPRQVKDIDYISLTFIFDTPSEGTFSLAKRIMARLTTETFKKAIPSVCAVTSVPATLRAGENYVHQIDVIFASHVANVRETITKVVYVIRTSGCLDTEPPQWWDENTSPLPTEVEKANWTARIKALLGIAK